MKVCSSDPIIFHDGKLLACIQEGIYFNRYEFVMILSPLHFHEVAMVLVPHSEGRDSHIVWVKFWAALLIQQFKPEQPEQQGYTCGLVKAKGLPDHSLNFIRVNTPPPAPTQPFG